MSDPTATAVPEPAPETPAAEATAPPRWLTEPVRPSAPDEVPTLVERARAAQAAWAATPVAARVRALAPLRARLLSRASEIAEILAYEVGKPVEEALLSEVLPNADLVDHWLDRIVDLLEPDEQHYSVVSFPGKEGKVYREPRGTLGLITPWNYPVAIPLRTLLPALLAGNAVVFKPSEVTPRAGALVASLFEGLLPYGVLTLAQGDRAVGAALCRSAVDLVVFTGSVAGGRAVAAACAERLVPCSLELGGKDAAIVLADANLERAARGVVWGAFTNAGQNCASIERVYVESAVSEPFLRRVVELTAALRPGLDTGRLTTEAQLQIVRRQVRAAIEAGAELLAGGVDPPAGELSYPPTVLRLRDEATPLMQDETFGPVLPVVVVGSADEAIARANQCRYGLTASLWTRHIPRAEALAQQLRVGVVTINNHGFTAALPSAPWSGFGETGHGITNGPHALAELTRPRFVLIDRMRSPRELWWYPYTPTLRTIALSMAALRGGSAGLGGRLRALFALLRALPRRLLGEGLGGLRRPRAIWPPAAASCFASAMRRLASWSLALLLLACSSDEGSSTPADTTPPAAIAGTQARFDLAADTTQAAGFFQLPYPSDLRLLNGAPDVRGWPNPSSLPLVEGLRQLASERKGFPVIPAAYFLFDAPLAPRADDQPIAADKGSPVLLIDVDPSSPDSGKLYPTVAVTLPPDDYTPDNLLAVAPRPGFVLHPNRRYAFVVQRSLNDAAGAPLGVPAALEALKAGQTPGGARGLPAADLYAPLWPALRKAGVDPAAVAAATVFTTTDVVADLFQLSDRVRAQHKIEITDLAVDPTDGAKHEGFCELRGKVKFPQFQRGMPPFNTDGTFDFSQGDVPVKQRDEEAPITITLPRAPMPEQGYPLVLYFHGSGGLSTAVVDRGTWRRTDDPTQCPPWPDTLRCDAKKNDPKSLLDVWDEQKGCNTAGQGPAYVLAPHGFATAASALPVNPERLECADETAYLNFNNLSAFRDTFRQGVIEQRLFLDALSSLTIDPAAVSACEGLSLPAGASAYKLSLSQLVAMGQSMGGMYTNMIAAVEPRIQAVAPTGAGGFWSYFILKTKLIASIDKKVALILSVPKTQLSFLHPGLQLLETAWEPADPIVFMPRVGKHPLPDHPARSIYEPVGKDDSYFPTPLYDAIALAYGHPQAGDEVWPTMQQALSLDGRQGLLPYPIAKNNTADTSASYTGAVIQYPGDGIYDPHALYSQRDEVKYQYSCFFESFIKTGTATIAAPAPLGSPCP